MEEEEEEIASKFIAVVLTHNNFLSLVRSPSFVRKSHNINLHHKVLHRIYLGDMEVVHTEGGEGE